MRRVFQLGIFGVLLSALSMILLGQTPPPSQSQVPDAYKKIKEYKLPSTFKNPKMQIVNLGVANWTPEGVRVMMGVNMFNPNKDSAKIKEMTYTMTVKGQYLGRGNYNQEFKLEPLQTILLTLPLDVRFADMPKPEELLNVMSDLNNKKKVQAEVDTYFVASKLGFTRRVHIIYREEDIDVKDVPKELTGVQLPQVAPQPVDRKVTATANIESVWLDNPAVSQQGEKGIELHAKFVIEGMLNQECIFAVFFYNTNGSKITTSLKDYSTPSGHATAQRRITPVYDSTSYEDFSVFIPAKALGRGTMYAKVQLITPDGIVLDTSRQEFTIR